MKLAALCSQEEKGNKKAVVRLAVVTVHQALKLVGWALGFHHELKPEKVHTDTKCICKQIIFVTR